MTFETGNTQRDVNENREYDAEFPPRVQIGRDYQCKEIDFETALERLENVEREVRETN